VQSAQPCPGWTWRPISALLAVLGLVSTAYLPVQYVWSVRGALGRRSAVLFPRLPRVQAVSAAPHANPAQCRMDPRSSAGQPADK